ncbi:hypothetical protein ACV2ER_06830, partial [Salmonella enterica subsp. enterica serovar Pomona]
MKEIKAKYLEPLFNINTTTTRLLHISARSLSERAVFFLSEPAHPARPVAPVNTLAHQYRAV